MFSLKMLVLAFIAWNFGLGLGQEDNDGKDAVTEFISSLNILTIVLVAIGLLLIGGLIFLSVWWHKKNKRHDHIGPVRV